MKTSVTSRLIVACLAVMLALASALSTQAATYATYTDRTDFLANVFLPESVDTFDDLNRGLLLTSPLSRTVAPYSYDLTASGGLFTNGTNTPVDTWISTASSNTVLTFTTLASTDGPVNAIGAYFFVVDNDGNVTAEPITVTVNGGDAPLTTSTASATNFFGWVTLADITSVEVTIGSTANRFATVNDVTFAVPEPSTYALLGLAIATGGVCQLRRRKVVAHKGS